MKSDFDEIGYWTEIKLDIVKEYASAYSRILSAQKNPPLYHLYIDAFAGAGVHISRATGEFVLGSPLNALRISPSFREYHLIDIESSRISSLESLTKEYLNVYTYEGDCNKILLSEVFLHAKYEEYRRALCLLDPYGLQLNWDVIQTAGYMKSVEIFLNFPVEDINRSVLWRNPDRVSRKQIARMNAYWGDESWRNIAYDSTRNLFGLPIKQDNESIALAFRDRLNNVAGFKYVTEPLPMRNAKGAIVYYLFFAAQKPVAEKNSKGYFREVSTPRNCLMAMKSSIEWTESTWNPLTGCTKVSPGCKHCYAERMALRLQAMGQPNYAHGFELAMHESVLELPLKWSKPQRIFVNSMSVHNPEQGAQ